MAPRRLRVCLAILVLSVLLALAPGLPTASAQSATASPSPTPAPMTIGQCLGSGQVWLHVAYGDQVLSNQCVGNPKSGTAALNQGGISIQQGNGGLICSLNSIPGSCPAGSTYDYWTYFHAGQQDNWSSYDYSQLGANSYQPPSASIEAWCFSRGSSSQGTHCTPEPLRIVTTDGKVLNPSGADPAVTTNPAVKPSGGSPLPTIAIGLAVIALLAVVLVRRRRRDGQRTSRQT